MKVGIIGNFNVDLMIASVTQSPEFDKEILADGYEVRLAGTAGYMALALKGLGFSPIIMSTIGDDYYGDFLIDRLKDNKIINDSIKILSNQQTPVSFVIVKDDGERSIVSVTGAHDDFDLSVYEENKASLQECSDIILCGNYLLPNFSVREALVVAKEQSANGKNIYFDPSWDPNGWSEKTCNDTFSLLNYVDVFMINETEICHLTKTSDWSKAIDVILSKTKCREIVVKLGPDGVVAFKDGEITKVPTKGNLKVIDTTGAGDIFDMGYIVGKSHYNNINEVLTFANEVAAAVITQDKDRKYPSRNEILNNLHGNVQNAK